jgi:hypothetical protein
MNGTVTTTQRSGKSNDRGTGGLKSLIHAFKRSLNERHKFAKYWRSRSFMPPGKPRREGSAK